MAMSKPKRILYHVLVTVFALLMIYPILWLVASSLKPNDEIFATSYSLIPSRLEFSNYATGFQGFGGTTFATFFKNSFIIVVISTIGAVASSALVAFGLARTKFFGQKFWFACMMATMMLPHDVVIVPQYVMFAKFGWLSSFKPLIIPHFFGTPFFIFLIMQFIRTIPKELDEAAKIDGCSKYGVFYRVVLPLIGPALITSSILPFTGAGTISSTRSFI